MNTTETIRLGEIINPSDKYTMRTNDWKAAVIGVILLGQGMMALNESPSVEGERRRMPIMLNAGQVKEWWGNEFDGEVFQVSFTNMVDNEPERVAGALKSVVLGGNSDWRLYQESTTGMTEEEEQAFWVKWDDERRSSLNQIGKRAREIADALLKDKKVKS